MARAFITFEGTEGSGKSTQIGLLHRDLIDRGFAVTVTREPGGCPIADQIRSILLDAANANLFPPAELLLYAAARAQHVNEVIRPALDRNEIVLCDRFTDATLAYQHFGRGLSREAADTLNEYACQGIRPDITFLIDCNLETGLSRATARINASSGPREERFELESLEFHKRVREGYRALAAAEPQRFRIIDGNRDIDRIRHDIAATLLSLLPGGGA